MKKLITTILLVLFCTSMVMAAVSGTRSTTVIRRNQYNEETVTNTEVHRVVTGIAKATFIAPNFYDNDWDNRAGYTSRYDFRYNIVTPDERDYLRTIPGEGFQMERNVTYYVDMTGQVWGTDSFTDHSETDTTTNLSIETYQIDPYTVVEVYVYTTLIEINNVVYEVVANMYDYSPIVLDLNGDGKIAVAKNQWMPHAPKFYRDFALKFDMTGDGNVEFTEWMAPTASDGLLVKPENGEVKNALQLFGTAGGYTDGYEKLSLVCDADKNGWVEGKELEGLKLWIDSNHNGICEANELKELSDYGVARIKTSHEDYKSTYMTDDGQARVTWDWWPVTLEVRKFRR